MSNEKTKQLYDLPKTNVYKHSQDEIYFSKNYKTRYNL
jgi:hypothetical protein